MENRKEDQPEGSLLIFSINPRDGTEEFVEEAINKFIKYSIQKEKAIIVCDTLRTNSYFKIDKYSWDTARHKCLTLGNTFMELISKSLKQLQHTEITIFRWDDLLSEKSYNDIQESVLPQVKSRPQLLNLLGEVAHKALLKRNPIKKWKKVHIDAGIDFFLEELTLLSYVFMLNGCKVKEVYYPSSKLRDAEEQTTKMRFISQEINLGLESNKFVCFEVDTGKHSDLNL